MLVGFALGEGRGIRPNEVVRIVSSESAKPLYAELAKAVWGTGGHVIVGYEPDDDGDVNVSRDFFELASEQQLDHFNGHYFRGVVDEMDHQVWCSLTGTQRAGFGRAGEDHAPRSGDAPAV